MASRLLRTSSRRRLGSAALGVALAATALVGPMAPSAYAHACSHESHQHGDIYWAYRGHHTHSEGAPYYGEHHVVFDRYYPNGHVDHYHDRHYC